MSQAELRKGRAEARIWQPMHSRLGIADDSLIFGRTVLAKVFVRGGLWEVDMPDDDGLAALLSAAYGKPIGVDDLILSKIKEAVHALRLGSRANAEEALNNPRFAALSSDGAERLAEAEAMMKAGATAGEILLKLAKDGGNPNHLPCGSPEGGRFCSPGAVGGVSAQDGGKIVDKAPKWANTPYAPLGTPLAGLNAVPGKDGGADCSGSVHAIYVDAGYSYTYTNSGNFAASAANGSIPFKEVSESERQPGDVVLYPGHMSIYAGDGMVWSAHQTGVSFRISSVTVFRGAPRYFRYQR